MLACLCGAYTTPYLQDLLTHTRACPAVAPAHAAYAAQLQERADALHADEGLQNYAVPSPTPHGRRIADISREEWLAAWSATAPGSAWERDQRTGATLGISRASARTLRVAYQPPPTRRDPATVTREEWLAAWTAAGRASSTGGAWGRLRRAAAAMQLSQSAARELCERYGLINANP